MKKIISNLSTQALIGVLLGILTGLFFGQSAAVLEPIGEVYVMLLQTAVYPYLLCTLIFGLGKLTPAIASRLFKRSWLIYIMITLFVFIIFIAFLSTFPKIYPILVYPAKESFNLIPKLLPLLIPVNIFSALERNFVPAIIVFAVLFGYSLQHIEKKDTLLDVLDTISRICIKYWRWLVKFAPIALFALMANTMGVTRLDMLQSLGIYLSIVHIITFLLTFWFLPSILSCLIPVSYRYIIIELRTAFLVAVVTTLSVAALPSIQIFLQKLLQAKHKNDENIETIVKTSLAVSYPFAQFGNYVMFLFIYFAAFYYQHPLSNTQQSFLPIITWISSVGSPSSSVNAINFLANWLSFPTTTTNLYVELMSITRYSQVLISVMGIAFLATIMSVAYFNRLKIKFKKLILNLLIFSIVTYGFVFLIKILEPQPQLNNQYNYMSFQIDPILRNSVDAKVIDFNQANHIKAEPSKEDSLLRIRQTRVLRVGYNPKVLPYVYFNKDHQLVGYDVALAYRLAKSLDSKLIFVPFTWNNLIKDLQENKFDIAMSSVFLTSSRAENVYYSEPNHYATMGFLVRQGMQDNFKNSASIINANYHRFASLQNKEKIKLLTSYLADDQLTVIPMNDYPDAINLLKEKKVDGIILPLYQARAWASLNPGLIAVEPEDLIVKIPVAFMMQYHSPLFMAYVSQWINIQKSNGVIQDLFSHWIFGEKRSPAKPRWDILNNILHL